MVSFDVYMPERPHKLTLLAYKNLFRSFNIVKGQLPLDIVKRAHRADCFSEDDKFIIITAGCS